MSLRPPHPLHRDSLPRLARPGSPSVTANLADVQAARRRWSWCALILVAAAAIGFSPSSRAGGGHDEAPKGSAAANRTAASDEAKAAAKAPPPVDLTSMDALRQRLADKVASVRAAQAPVRAATPVSATQGGESAHAAVKAAPRHAAATPQPNRTVAPANAAALAAAHRSEVGAAPAGHAHAAHWSYGGEGGPAAWAQLKPEFATCGAGTRQSPIDIRGGIRVDLDPIKFDYKPAGFNVIDNGHTVQVNIGGGNAIEVGGRRYDLVQFHFHRPSEERINGRQFEMVAHLVHKDLEGRLAVVAVLMEAGRAHPVVQQVWNNLPLEKNEEQRAASALDVAQLLPEDKRYFTYMGSLTTPPCSEGVLWLVLKQPVALTQDQIAVFGRLYSNNARPIQSVAGRLIKESN